MTNATVFNTSLLQCYTPIWLYKAKSVNVEVSRFNTKLQTGFCDETICKTTNALITYTKLLNITFTNLGRVHWCKIPVSGGISLIEGNGFNMSSADIVANYNFRIILCTMWYRRLPSRYHLLELFAFCQNGLLKISKQKWCCIKMIYQFKNVIHHLNKTIRSLDPANKAGVSRPLLFTV